MSAPPAPRYRVASPPADRPLLVFDGDCGFCRLWVERWRARTGDRVDYAPSAEAAPRFPEIPAAAFDRSVILIEPDGTAFDGAEAALRALARGGTGALLLALHRRIPGAAGVVEAVYGFVARHRTAFSRATRLFWGRRVTAPSFRIARCLWLRALGGVYLLAFLSLAPQILGLAGSNGILPIAHRLEAASASLGPERFWLMPTLCWLDSGDGALLSLCWGGALISALLLFGLLPGPCLVLLWGIYLSIVTAGGIFLGYQWDNLLLEAGLLSIFLAPASWRCRLPCAPAPSRVGTLLARWLLFRLMFSSGVVKLSSGDAAWRDLTALRHHYETQPLPTWTSWYAHHLPGWLQAVSVVVMFAIELAAPFAVLAPRRVRYLGAGVLLSLQIAIAGTGNYGFFNLISIALLILLVDDADWPRFLAARAAGTLSGANPGRRGRTRMRIIAIPVAGVLMLLGGVNLVEAFRVPVRWPAPIRTLAEWERPFRSVNWYGLFSVMTTSRPEIVVEGSQDGSTWRAYEFRWKPGDPSVRPRFVAPHMPRLDWQMWFAALGSYRSASWFGPFAQRLLEGSPEVLGLLGRNPFPESPPRYVRAVLYDYRFTEPGAGADWWRREPKGLFVPPLALRRSPG